HRRPRLVEARPVKRNAEFDRHGSEPSLPHRADVIEIHDLPPPGREANGMAELIDYALDEVILDRHTVGRDVVAPDPIEVSPPHRVDGKTEASCDLLDDGFDGEHGLWPAIASKRRVRHGVGLAGKTAETDVGKKIAIVGVA